MTISDKGYLIAQTIGEAPRQIIEDNLYALISDKSLPYAQATGQVSSFTVAVKPASASSIDPRSHGSQVK